MLSKKFQAMFYVILLGTVLGVTIQPAKGQDLKGFSRPRTVTRATSVRTIPNGEKVTLTGNITKGEGDMITVCDFSGAETVVVLNPETKISTHRRGIFRGAEKMNRGALLIGLRVQARGRGNEAGQLTAKWVAFHDADFRAETQLHTRAVPIEAELLRQGEQLEETDGIAKTALKNANNAQESADKAQSTADGAKSDAANAQATAVSAHSRIGSLDDFEVVSSITVTFKAGSFQLTEDSKSKLDEFASKAISTKGYIVELSGYASSEGGTYSNNLLSAKRNDAVVDYLVGVRSVPIRRIVVPYSGGEMNPVADNKTREGREQNRRVEVKMLVSKGLAAGEQVATKSDK
jgi:Outer membrane protein and related peptidoglycan-associated (lipo)proteins